MGKYSASRPVSKQQKQEVAVLTALGAKTKEIAQTLGLSSDQVRSQLKRDDTRALITQLKDTAFDKWAVVYHLVPETLAEDLRKATKLDDRRALREEIIRLIQAGDITPAPASSLPLTPGQTRVTAVSIDALMAEASQLVNAPADR